MRIPTWVLRDLENKITPTLRNCTNFTELKKIHAHMFVSSLSQSNFLATQVINVCNNIGRVDYAALVFSTVIEPNVFLYNSMIMTYTKNHHYSEAIRIYMRLHAQTPNSADRFTYPFALKACAGLLSIDLGRQIHTHVFKSGVACNTINHNSLIELYIKCDDLMNAHKLFDEMGLRDVASWNLLISAYARLGHMRQARAIFNSMTDKTVVSWTALISGYTAVGCYTDAVEVFHQMHRAGIEPDGISIVSVLPACAQLGALELGRWIHAFADKQGLLRKTFVSNALIEMYAKCGSIDQARHIFYKMPQRDVISWSTMIGGLAAHGSAAEAIQLFVRMESEKTVVPNRVTLLGVLSACAHGGLLEEGIRYFDSMKEIYGIDPEIEHYGCMVDLFGRAGRIDQATEVINSMPMAADAATWGCLLSACRAVGDIGMAVKAAEQLVELEPEATGNYVLLSNIYATLDRWDDAANMRRLIRSKRLMKTAGSSLIEVNNMVQEFIAGDYSSPHLGEIRELLDILALHFGRIGVLSDMDGEHRNSTV